MALEAWDLEQDDDGYDGLVEWLALMAPPSIQVVDRVADTRPKWQLRASCHGLGMEMFFATEQMAIEAAVSVCSTCQVAADELGIPVHVLS